MVDREKIIEDIEDGILMARATSTRIVHLHVDKIEEILSLLKEQDAVEPDSEHHLFVCPVCRSVLRRNQKFCHECGKSIEWEGR